MESYYRSPQKRKRKLIWIFIPIILVIGFLIFFSIKAGFTISKVIELDKTENLPPDKEFPQLPLKDPDIINILLLGNRGANEPGEGRLLSDTIIIISLKKPTDGQRGQAAIISIPRDLYVDIWGLWQKYKINYAYAYGGFPIAKKTISMVTGLYIDYAVSVDFEALTEIIDELGGVNIYLNETFEENIQWAQEGTLDDNHWQIKEINGQNIWTFNVPGGNNLLDGKTALYYVRSRMSSSDFDRMRRQQQVMMAIKDKALSLGVLVNPIKIYNLLDILSDHIKIDAPLSQIKDLVDSSSDFDREDIKRKIFDISPDGLLYETMVNNEYVLLPIGDNFDKIQEACRNIFN